MNMPSVCAPLDVDGILERAGADADAAPGTQGWALAQVGRLVAEMAVALRDCADADQPMPQMHAAEHARAVLARVAA